MLANSDIRVATSHDAQAIAGLSRHYIEHGLSWSWTPARVLQTIGDPAANVVVVEQRHRVLGFGIMQYGDETAHLALLAVYPTRRHLGLGARLLAWLEQSARVAGIRRVRLEARADNHSAIAFYRRLGFSQSGKIAGYYEGVVDAVQLEKRLA